MWNLQQQGEGTTYVVQNFGSVLAPQSIDDGAGFIISFSPDTVNSDPNVVLLSPTCDNCPTITTSSSTTTSSSPTVSSSTTSSTTGTAPTSTTTTGTISTGTASTGTISSSSSSSSSSTGSSSSEVTITQQLVNSWNAGSQWSVTVTNTGDTTLFYIQIYAADYLRITDIWSVTVEGEGYYSQPPWIFSIPPQTSFIFGYISSDDNEVVFVVTQPHSTTSSGTPSTTATASTTASSSSETSTSSLETGTPSTSFITASSTSSETTGASTITGSTTSSETGTPSTSSVAASTTSSETETPSTSSITASTTSFETTGAVSTTGGASTSSTTLSTSGTPNTTLTSTSTSGTTSTTSTTSSTTSTTSSTTRGVTTSTTVTSTTSTSTTGSPSGSFPTAGIYFSLTGVIGDVNFSGYPGLINVDDFEYVLSSPGGITGGYTLVLDLGSAYSQVFHDLVGGFTLESGITYVAVEISNKVRLIEQITLNNVKVEALSVLTIGNGSDPSNSTFTLQLIFQSLDGEIFTYDTNGNPLSSEPFTL